MEAAKRSKMGVSVADLIDRYLATSRKEIGRTKAQVLGSIKALPIGERAAEKLTHADLTDYAAWLGQGRQPQTAGNYLSHLLAVLSVARTGFRAAVDRA